MKYQDGSSTFCWTLKKKLGCQSQCQTFKKKTILFGQITGQTHKHILYDETSTNKYFLRNILLRQITSQIQEKHLTIIQL